MIQSFMRHSCSKISVLSSPIRAEAERSLTAFVAGTTRSIKLPKVRICGEIINSTLHWGGFSDMPLHRSIQGLFQYKSAL